MVRFEAIEVAVEVTTDCMPPMSLVIRDCTSPVRVRVKKRDRLALQVGEDVGAQPVHDPLADLACEIQVWTTPSAAVTAATATMPTTSQTSSVQVAGRAARRR